MVSYFIVAISWLGSNSHWRNKYITEILCVLSTFKCSKYSFLWLRARLRPVSVYFHNSEFRKPQQLKWISEQNANHAILLRSRTKGKQTEKDKKQPKIHSSSNQQIGFHCQLYRLMWRWIFFFIHRRYLILFFVWYFEHVQCPLHVVTIRIFCHLAIIWTFAKCLVSQVHSNGQCHRWNRIALKCIAIKNEFHPHVFFWEKKRRILQYLLVLTAISNNSANCFKYEWIFAWFLSHYHWSINYKSV